MSNEELNESNPLAYFYKQVADAQALGDTRTTEQMLERFGQDLTEEQKDAVRRGDSNQMTTLINKETPTETSGTCISGGPEAEEPSEFEKLPETPGE